MYSELLTGICFQEYLDKRQMTEWGNKNLVEEGQGQGTKLALPGVKEGNFSARHWKPEVRVMDVQFSPTGGWFSLLCL